jgi:hypothetical protein
MIRRVFQYPGAWNIILSGLYTDPRAALLDFVSVELRTSSPEVSTSAFAGPINNPLIPK